MHGLKSAIFLRNWLIGCIGHALLVEPFISTHRKWLEMVVSASINQVWTKITVRSYAWPFGHSDPDSSNVNSDRMAESAPSGWNRVIWQILGVQMPPCTPNSTGFEWQSSSLVGTRHHHNSVAQINLLILFCLTVWTCKPPPLLHFFFKVSFFQSALKV